MPTVLKGRRAIQMLSWAHEKLFFMGQQPAPFLRAITAVPGGVAIASKAGPHKNIYVDYPDPDMVFIRQFAGDAVLPRFAGRAGELFEDAVGVVNPSNLDSTIPFDCYAAPHHLGGGFYTNPRYDANPVSVHDARLGTTVSQVNAGVEIYSKHPMVRYVPYASSVLTPSGSPALPSIGVCPLGERTVGVFEFIFHIGPVGADPAAIKTDTANMNAGAGAVMALPAPPSGAYVIFTPHWCPIARGSAAYLQVFSDAAYVPQLVFLKDWGATVSTLSLLSVDPAYEADTVLNQPLPPQSASFARIATSILMFAYYNSKHNDMRLFTSFDEGATWHTCATPLPALDWVNHFPIGFTVGGPSLLTCFGEGCVMFATIKQGVGTTHVWYSTNQGASWAEMQFALPLDSIWATAGPTVIKPYKSSTDQGELALLVRNTVTGVLSVYVTQDLGTSWQFRGIASSATDASTFGFNLHAAYTGTYDHPAPVLAGRPGMMELTV